MRICHFLILWPVLNSFRCCLFRGGFPGTRDLAAALSLPLNVGVTSMSFFDAVDCLFDFEVLMSVLGGFVNALTSSKNAGLRSHSSFFFANGLTLCIFFLPSMMKWKRSTMPVKPALDCRVCSTCLQVAHRRQALALDCQILLISRQLNFHW